MYWRGLLLVALVGCGGGSKGKAVVSDGGAPDGSAPVALQVVLTGDGLGAVSSQPAGITCGSTCSARFAPGTKLTLTAASISDLSVFGGWTGACAGTSPSCELTLTEDARVEAIFATLGQRTGVRLSPTDKSEELVLARDNLGFAVSGLGTEGVRSGSSIAAGSGVFYFEGERKIPLATMYFGVATAKAPRDGVDPGGSDQLFALDTVGELRYAGARLGAFDADAGSHYGFVVDYRGAHPFLYVIAMPVRLSEDAPHGPAIVWSGELSAISDPLFIYAGGIRRSPELQQEVNPGNDTVNAPFAFDPGAVLRAAGVAAADALVLGWGGTYAGAMNAPPALNLGAADAATAVGAPVTVSATALDPENGDLGAYVRWEDLSSPFGTGRVVGAGPSWTFTPDEPGVHILRARVTDGGGKTTFARAKVTVGGEVPVAATVQLQADPALEKDASLSSDGLGARFTSGAQVGMRANQGLLHGFQYFELTRTGGPGNVGGGVVTRAGSLRPFQSQDVPASCAANGLGSVWQNLVYQASFDRAAQVYGFAVDARGESPVVYVLAGGTLAYTCRLPDVGVPLYPFVYGSAGNHTDDKPDVSLNFGTKPFVHDARAVLGAAGVDAQALQLGWGAHVR